MLEDYDIVHFTSFKIKQHVKKHAQQKHKDLNHS